MTFLPNIGSIMAMLKKIMFKTADLLFRCERKIKITVLPFFLALSLFGLSISGCSSWEPEPAKRANIKAYVQLSHLPSDYPTKHVPDGTIWRDFSNAMDLPANLDKPIVREQVRWWMKQQNFLNSVLTRGGQYFYYIYQQTKVRNLPSELALIPVFESGYVPVSKSHKSAVGLWQFLRGTGKSYGIRIDKNFDGRHDVVASTNAALKYLTYLYYFFDKDWLLAIAAYNCGEGRVQAEILKNRRRGERTDFWSLSTLPRDTREYVPRLLALAAVIKNKQKYGVALVPINNGPYFEAIRLSKQISLSKVAKMSGASDWSIKMLNAGYIRGVTEEDGPSIVLVPKSKAAAFKARLEGKTVEDEVLPVTTSDVVVSSEKVSEELDKVVVVNTERDQNKAGKEKDDDVAMTPKDSGKKKSGKSKKGGKADDEEISGGSAVHEERPSSRDKDARDKVVKMAEVQREKHVVKRGENLFSIARKYKTTTATLRRLNGLDSNKLRLHQILVVSAAAVKNDTDNENIGDKEMLEGSEENITVTKAKPETKKSVKTQKVVGSSDGSEAVEEVDGGEKEVAVADDVDNLAQKASYTVPYRVAQGDTVFSIARRFKVSTQQIRQANGLKSNSVKVGRVLNIPVIESTKKDRAVIRGNNGQSGWKKKTVTTKVVTTTPRSNRKINKSNKAIASVSGKNKKSLSKSIHSRTNSM